MFLSLKRNKPVEVPDNKMWYDETISQNGGLKNEWQVLLNALNKLGSTEVIQRNVDLQKLLRENGVTYNVYEGHLAMPRTWNLDPVPWVLDAADWLKVEEGLTQRAELLNFILKDLYGPKELLKKGLIPHEVVFCHRGFLRQCDGIPFGTQRPLAVYAADVARGPDGRMWVVNDRTQAPSGMGYALENRSAMMSVLPEIFKGQQIRKISDFFNIYYNSLCELAPRQKENPRIALLTPGDKNETYFEQAFLADYLGINLVHGDDLLVKDSHLWIKTIHGLEQIDILVRRVDDVFCDPLEFRSDSRLGVPGLLEVVRKGNLTIANPLGSGILENPGLMPFLNTISKHYFGEGLKLPTVATWWCGHTKERNQVFANFDNLIIKKIDRYNGSPTIIPAHLTRFDRERLIERIKHEPYLYVGQEKVGFSAVPSLVNNELDTRFSVLRGFAVGNNKGYKVMPGGLTRTSPEKGIFVVSNQAGGVSKDTWVVTAPNDLEAQTTVSVNKVYKPRLKESLTSRMAENLFWAGRYSERVLATVRLLKTTISHILENQGNESALVIKERLLSALTHLTMTYPGFVGDDKSILKEPMVHLFELAQNEDLPGSLLYNMRSLVNAMQSVGGYLSNDTRRMVENLKENGAMIKKIKPTGFLNLNNSLDKLYNSLVSLLGFITESMPREQGWLMFQAGRKIERSSLIATLVRSTLVFKDNEQVQPLILESVLKTNQLISTYRYKYRTYLNLEYALQLLLFDENNPRSIAYQLQKLTIYLKNLIDDENEQKSKELKIVIEANTKLIIADPSELAQSTNEDFVREKLEDLLSELSDLIAQCANAINQKYFSHTSEVKNLVATTNEI